MPRKNKKDPKVRRLNGSSANGVMYSITVNGFGDGGKRDLTVRLAIT